ncbi:hypothetical protein CBR_g6696 [Chara braunii]|uniref:asparaginase n=1 Tax=Chara braunii TaxID=69332 RepID=A0A388KKI5_CHABU|nr:hypothetical protein CBR_g6696 [Chara braunii]|eukprot:GBG70570.1 hypothetical protein CBR_g6696 [Chara braunii]
MREFSEYLVELTDVEPLPFAEEDAWELHRALYKLVVLGMFRFFVDHEDHCIGEHFVIYYVITRPKPAQKEGTVALYPFAQLQTIDPGLLELIHLELLSIRQVIASEEEEIQPRFADGGCPAENVVKPLPRVLLLHTGGTLGMDPKKSFEEEEGAMHLKKGTGGEYPKTLRPGIILQDLKQTVPELRTFANLDVQVAFNRDSCRIGPRDWIKLAKTLHEYRGHYDAFLIVHGTDTMSYTACALSLMLPLAMARSDARQNLVDSLTCATAGPAIGFQEVALCFGGLLLRGNRARKTNSSSYRAFSSPTYPPLATLGVEVEWDKNAIASDIGIYRPRFELNPNVIRVPIVPGTDPRQMYLSTQCDIGSLQPQLYRSGSFALALGAEPGPKMTPECAVVKLMLCLAHPDIPLGQPIAGEL